MTEHNKNSRYAHAAGGATESNGRFLQFYERQVIEEADDDEPFAISPEFENRPDLIANKFYGQSNLKWVIMLRNNILNPLTDLTVGKVLMIPSKVRLNSEILS